MDAQVTFIGRVVPAGKKVTIAADFDNNELETIHFTQAAFPPKPSKGPHTIYIENEDGKFAVGTLDTSICTQFSMDVTIAGGDVTISHTGASDVHLTGYKTVAIIGSDDDEDYAGMEDMMLYRKGGRGSSDEEDNDEDDDDEEEEEESEDEEPPRAVPLGKTNRMLVEDEASEGSEDEDDSSEEDDDEEEDEESSEEEDEEEEEEEKEKEAPSKSAKRKQTAQTPQPAKKAKAADVEKAPATAPAKVKTPNGDSPADDKEFTSALKSFLQKNGPCKLSVLGTSVKRPPKSPKFKKIIEQHKDIFSFNPVTDTVSLTK